MGAMPKRPLALAAHLLFHSFALAAEGRLAAYVCVLSRV